MWLIFKTKMLIYQSKANLGEITLFGKITHLQEPTNRQVSVRGLYSKSPLTRTYQNKNLEAVFPKLCTLQLRTFFSLMKHRFLLQRLQS